MTKRAEPSDLRERDSRVLWHPYTQHGLGHAVLPVRSAQGALLRLEALEGKQGSRQVIDAISSWWVNLHGHSHPRLVEAIRAQAARLEHVLFAGFTHEPAVELAELLTEYPPLKKAGLSRVFYSDNGSTAVEVALKMAYQYPLNQGKAAKPRFLAVSGAYHGDTLGAMAVGEPDGFHQRFRPLLPQVDFVRAGDVDHLRELVELNPGAYAAWIFEPLVQGAAGMRMIDPGFFNQAAKICRENGILLICDEIFTGFFRTGRCFAFEYLDLQPDFVCLSKGITGGFLPLSVTLTTEALYGAFCSPEIRDAFLHGHSYTANPIACAVAIESWKMLHTSECQSQIERITRTTKECIDALRGHSRVAEGRSLGTIGAIDVKDVGNYFSSSSSQGGSKTWSVRVKERSIEKGVLLRPLGNVLYAVPPYCITDSDLQDVYQVMQEVIEED